MKLLSYERDGAVRHGRLLDDGRIAELGDGDLGAVIVALDGNWDRLTTEVVGTYDPAGVRVLAPVPNPPKVLAAAANYQEHVLEGGGEPLVKERLAPRMFLKPGTSVTGPDAVIALPDTSAQVDWEAELVVVLGRGGRDVAVADALGLVAGYAVGNDVSARSLDLGYERDAGAPGASAEWFFDWLAGKWFDGFAPFGPWLVTPDEVGDPQDLAVRLEVNGKLRQDGSTRDMIFDVAELIAHCSRLMTLQPGDVIFTGTPSGVGAATGEFLRSGDEMTVTVDRLGTLVNTVR
ncbi:fumarylacetoacetate hydrolase family protein [Yinghuangia sp. YIM S09857]|uniref:fumarylacetoacetate hydrolase family protein n=1 Tax=Yinghuangia sp. YIM S09857 TaxID=3436929 RepID=UPI003F52AEA1